MNLGFKLTRFQFSSQETLYKIKVMWIIYDLENALFHIQFPKYFNKECLGTFLIFWSNVFVFP